MRNSQEAGGIWSRGLESEAGEWEASGDSGKVPLTGVLVMD